MRAWLSRSPGLVQWQSRSPGLVQEDKSFLKKLFLIRGYAFWFSTKVIIFMIKMIIFGSQFMHSIADWCTCCRYGIVLQIFDRIRLLLTRILLNSIFQEIIETKHYFAHTHILYIYIYIYIPFILLRKA